MNINKPDNEPPEIKIKKLNILAHPKNPSNSHFSIDIFPKNSSQNLYQIPFLLKNTSNDSTNMTTMPFKKKFLSLLKRNKSRKSFVNISRNLFDEPTLSEIKNDINLKSNEEMKNKFYIRQRNGLKIESESGDILNITKETPSNFLHLNVKKKYFLKSKNYKEENTTNKNNYFKRKIFRNRSESTFINNNVNNSIKKYFKEFQNITKKNKTKKFSSFIMPKLNSMTTKNFRQKQKGINEYNFFENKNKYYYKNRKSTPKIKDIEDKSYETFTKIIKKRAKENAKLFAKSLLDIRDDNEPYEPIYESESEKNIRQKIFFNKNNLDRIIKVEKTNKKGFNEDDVINSVYKIKKMNDDQEFILTKLKQTWAPRAIKANNFLHSTLVKYNNLHRSNFGFPS